MSDSFFDMPAGYRDADLEMSALEDAGNQYARLCRKVGGAENVQALRDGATITRTCYVDRDPAQPYSALIRMFGHVYADLQYTEDAELRYSVDGGETWHDTAKAARLAGITA